MPMSFQTGARSPYAKKVYPDGGPHVFIAIPSYKEINVAVMTSLISALNKMLTEGIHYDVGVLTGDCHVDDARNSLVASFLDTEATHLLFVDADVTFSPDSLVTLVKHNKDVVGGTYRFKRDDEDYPIVLFDKDNIHFDDNTGLVQVKGVPGGLLCIKRRVIEKLYKKFKSKGVWTNKTDHGQHGIVEIFARTVESGRSRRSGDYEFCCRAAKAGFKIWLVPSLKVGHIGDKHWEGSIQDYWLRKSGKYQQDAVVYLDQIVKGAIPDEDVMRVICKAFGNAPYAVDHIFLMRLFEAVKMADHPVVLETGSGVSTAVIVAAGGTNYSLESEPGWLNNTAHFLSQFWPIPSAMPIYAPMVKHEAGEWYETRQVEDVRPDIVVIDGPARKSVGERARIINILPETLVSAHTVFVDDCDDGDGELTVKALEDRFGFEFTIHRTPRRDFAIGVKGDNSNRVKS